MIEVCLASQAGQRIADRIADDSAVAPDLIDAETFAVLTLRRKRNELSAERLRGGLRVLMDAPMARVANRELLATASRLTSALSGYDALYAALAVLLDASVITSDSGFASTAATQLGLPAVHFPV